ncbi:hypothetical protein VNI00_018981 [Paramarasmius palmivorus]|uniref:Uncharacterized protein n=1 Tax=Paramarasmius palmivorus TaxID=297713 RepID=A0AAW0ASS0_9AGAR
MEYGYSPEVHQRYLESQARIARWCDTAEAHSQEYKAPFGARSDANANEQWDGVTRVTRGEPSRSSGIAAPRRFAPAAKSHKLSTSHNQFKLSKPHKSHKSTLPPSYIPPQYAQFQHTRSRTYTTSVLRTSDTGFFDPFRKPKSKPPTPTSKSLLRPTSDATTSAFQSQLRSPVYTSGLWSRTPTSLPTSRVVVREKMTDLASAAKQEIKARGVRQDSVQTPALHGLGVEESVGAALLADRLPSPSSPGSSSTNHGDNRREELLKAAVSYPLENSNSPVMSPVQLSPSSETMSPMLLESGFGARFISHPIIDNHPSPPLPKPPSTSHSVTSRGFTGPTSRDPPVPRSSRLHDSECMDSEEGSHLSHTVVSKRECKPRDIPEHISHIPSSQDTPWEPYVHRYNRSQPSNKIVDGTCEEVENPRRIPYT